MVFHCFSVFVLITGFALSQLASNTQLLIFVESSTHTSNATREALRLNLNISSHYELLQLNGINCNEFSMGGSVMVSGIQQALRILRATELANQTKSLHVIIVTTRCIRECLSFIQRYDITTTMLSVTPRAHDRLLDDIIYLTLPTLFLIDAFLVLSRSLHWIMFGLITDHFTTRIAEYLKYAARNQNVMLSPIIKTTGLNESIESIVQQVERSGAKVLVLLTQEAPQILCAAHHRGMVWPHYGWLLYGSSSPDINQLPTCRGSHHYLEGTIFPTYYSSLATKASLEETAIQLVSKASTTATPLHIDSKSALLRMTVPGIPGNLTFHNIQHDIPAVYFIQVRNGTATSVATVHNDTVLVNRWLQEEELPRGTLPVRVNTVYPTWLGALKITVSGTLITITLVLYVYYRKEPEVRATSWTLSLLILLGCYIITVYLLLLVLRTVVSPIAYFDLCPLLVWTSGIGLSVPLILAVLLVKLARVYRIFYHYNEIGKFWSNVALAIYVLLLLIPSILVLTMMSALQSYKWSTVTNTHTYHIEVMYVCAGDLTPYYVAQACYLILLIVCIVVIVLKTRKLRYKNFQDAKKVNIFASILVLVSILGLIVIKVFLDRGLYLPAYTCLHVTHCIVIVACLGFLFMPKLSPIINRKYFSSITNSPTIRKNYLLDDLSRNNTSPQREQNS